MRDDELTDRKTEKTETAIIRRMRSPRRIKLETAEIIFFDVAAFKLDRGLGIREHIAVERNLTIVSRWPEVLS
ncbi:hypothetical protein BH24ACI3_BH24ACI3_10640 [soil metagenome]